MAFTAASLSPRHGAHGICRVDKIACTTVAAWAIWAFTPVFDGLWRRCDFAHASRPSFAPLPTLRLHRIRLLQLREISILFQRFDDAEIEIVVGVPAADVGSDRLELGEHVPGAI